MNDTRIHILVTGANGQLGMELKQLASGNDFFQFTFVSREQLAIDDTTALASFFSTHVFDYCINCAAYTAVDKAESERDAAMAINARAVGELARLCKQHNTRFVHFSTDYVFDGDGKEPYRPEDPTSPVNFYGETKLAGEKAALHQNESSIIIRTSWVYSSFGKNFVKTMIRLMGERESIGVVKDQVGSPTYAADLAGFVLHIIQNNLWQPGVYHYCNKGIISWYHFADTIKELTGSSCIVNAITTADFPTPAKRPTYSALCTLQTEAVFGEPMKDWKESLQRCLHIIAR